MIENDILSKIIDSNNHKVGGGSSSAISGAMAAGMISMVSKLSLKINYGLLPEEYNNISIELDFLAKKLLEGASLDEDAFCNLMKSYSLPKLTEDERNIRNKAIQKSSTVASSVPSDNGFMCSKVYKLGQKLIGKSNPTAESDLLIAIKLSEVGIYGCILNIQANLVSIKNDDIIIKFNKNINDLKNYKGE